MRVSNGQEKKMLKKISLETFGNSLLAHKLIHKIGISFQTQNDSIQ